MSHPVSHKLRDLVLLYGNVKWQIVMSEIFLNKLSADNANWLSVRQSLVSSNIANAKTHGYKALDVKEMSEASNSFSSMVRTHERHIQAGVGTSAGIRIERETPWETNHSGGTVSLPQEMIKAGEVASAYQLNTSVMKSFHRMFISVFGN